MNSPNPDALQDLKVTRVWWDDHGHDVFRTYQSLVWFLREHKAELIASGDMFVGRGAKPTRLGPGAADSILKIMMRQSKADIEA